MVGALNRFKPNSSSGISFFTPNHTRTRARKFLKSTHPICHWVWYGKNAKMTDCQMFH